MHATAFTVTDVRAIEHLWEILKRVRQCSLLPSSKQTAEEIYFGRMLFIAPVQFQGLVESVLYFNQGDTLSRQHLQRSLAGRTKTQERQEHLSGSIYIMASLVGHADVIIDMANDHMTRAYFGQSIPNGCSKMLRNECSQILRRTQPEKTRRSR